MSEPSPSAPRGKPATRRTLLARRDALTESERAAASVEIALRADKVLVAHGARCVALYAAKGTEVGTAKLDNALRGRGVRVVYPRVVPGEKRLAFAAVAIDDLILGTFGLREPSPDAPRVKLDEIDAFVVPGVAFDREGGRVGWGRGFYDATLADPGAEGAVRMGIAFECQLVDEITRDPHDVAMTVLVTEVATREMTRPTLPPDADEDESE